jgi:cytochrome bd-type quinol oxidase subunit 2
MISGIFLAPLLAVGTAGAQASEKAACEGLGGNFNGGSCSVAGQPQIDTVITQVIQVMSAIAGVAAVIMIIISGFRFITANGDSSTIAAARRTLIYALVGLVIVAISQSIVWFVLGRTVG